ncbi:malate:quinone oxidoreductase [Pedobacter sp. AJM]|uniref:malate:quinone oxidoreductase n=1 Tax=Pedobacter sp. AJM TaxID=2003629 RepID=UPI0026A89FBA
MTKKKKTVGKTDVDVILIGAGIMSATLGVLLKELEPGLSIEIYERLDIAAAESSDAWNNAGTGHSAFCELNYTPEKKDGTVETKKAVQIAENFEVSKQFWAYLIEKGLVSNPGNFIRKIPHMSFVWGKKNVEYLKKRYEALQKCTLFSEMEYTEDAKVIDTWAPLIMDGRKKDEKIAATKMDLGTDVNFGSLTRDMFSHLKEQENVNLYFNHEIRDLKKNKDDNWAVKSLPSGKAATDSGK